MRLFLGRLTLFLGIQLFVWSLILWSYARQRPFATEVGAATIDKQQLLAQQPSPRVILVGGSNLNFGINSPDIERRTGYHPVNMGLNIGDGLAFMLKNVEPWVRPGDVVIVSPEYEHFGDFYNGRGDYLYAEVEHRPRMITSFTVDNYLEVLKKGYIIPGQILRYTLERRGAVVRGYLADRENVYRRGAFNQYGDLVGHYNSKIRLNESSLNNGPSNSDITPESIQRAIDGLNKFNARCRERGVQVYYSFPPVPRGLLQKDGIVIKSIASELEHKLQFTILDTPEEMSFPLDDFFDGYYHLTQAGGQARSNFLIDRFLSVNKSGNETH